MLEQTKQNTERQSLVLIVALGFLLRLALAFITEGYLYDTSTFLAWGLRMASLGASDFYVADYYCDYPPGYLYVLGVVGQLITSLELYYLDALSQLLLVVVPCFAEAGVAVLVYAIARKEGQAKWALQLAAFVSFCPVFWYDTAIWKQIDAVMSLLLLGCFALLAKRRFLPAAALFGLALVVKPQALMVGPVLALCFLFPVFFAADTKEFWRAIRTGVLGVLSALAPVYLCALPFYGFGNTTVQLYALYFDTVTSYPYASVNAFNFMAAMGGNWVSQTSAFTISLFGTSMPTFFTWEIFGTVAIFCMTLFMVVLALYARKNNSFSPLLLAAVYFIGVFTFANRMHERYLLFGVALLLGAVAHLGSTRLLSLAGGFSITALINMAAVYTCVGTDDEWLTSATSVLVTRITGLAETAFCVLLLYEAWRICSGKVCVGKAAKESDVADAINASVAQAIEVDDTTAQATETGDNSTQERVKEYYVPAPQPKWCKAEIFFLSVLTAAVAVLSFSYLGDFTAPQNPLDASTSSHTETVLVDGDVESFWMYPAVTKSGATLMVAAEDGTILLEVELAVGGLFQWASYSVEDYDAYTVTVSGVSMMELCFKDAAGDVLAVTAIDASGEAVEVSALFDEPSLVPDEISQLNGFYFDEIYHARTAYESANGLAIYEISHPPMGKNFLAFGVMLFGMTGFGWRFSGVLFGVLMVPVIYWLTRRLSRSVKAAGLVALLLSFDFMRYVQSRIATIDTISAFFILLAATCMVWYCQSVLEKGVRKSVLPMALAGLAFGFGAASKWTGLYAGAGLAILYFGVLILRLVQENRRLVRAQVAQTDMSAASDAQEAEQEAAVQSAKSVHTAQQAAAAQNIQQPKAVQSSQAKSEFKHLTRTDLHKEFYLAIGGGVLFFVIIPLMIYIASYLPYRLADPSFGLAEWWANQEYMLWYHSSLDATHPFSSSWYSWFLDLRPVWYYMGSGLESGTYASIAGFYNPIICWVGALAWLRLSGRALLGKTTLARNALIVLLLSQLLPWFLVTRCTFLYHYYPSFLFTVVAIGLWFKDICAKNEDRAYALASGLLTLAIFFFVWFFPVLSGLPVGTLWAQTLKLLPSYGFYIIS